MACRLRLGLTKDATRILHQHLISATRVTNKGVYLTFGMQSQIIPSPPGTINTNKTNNIIFAHQIETLSFTDEGINSIISYSLMRNSITVRLTLEEQLKIQSQGHLPQEDCNYFTRFTSNGMTNIPDIKNALILHIPNPQVLIQHLQVIIEDNSQTNGGFINQYSNCLIFLKYFQGRIALEVTGNQTNGGKLTQYHFVNLIQPSNQQQGSDANDRYNKYLECRTAARPTVSENDTPLIRFVFSDTNSSSFSATSASSSSSSSVSKHNILLFLRRFVEIIPPNANSLVSHTNTDSPLTYISLSIGSGPMKRQYNQISSRGPKTMIGKTSLGWQIIGDLLSSRAVVNEVPFSVSSLFFDYFKDNETKVKKTIKQRVDLDRDYKNDDDDHDVDEKDDSSHDMSNFNGTITTPKVIDSHNDANYLTYKIPVSVIKLMYHLNRENGEMRMIFYQNIIRILTKYSDGIPFSKNEAKFRVCSLIYSPIDSYSKYQNQYDTCE